MSLKVCASCKTAYLPAQVCPQCGSAVFWFDWEEEDMPKTTVEGGPSAYNDENPAPDDTPKPAAEPKAAKPKTPVSKPRVADAGEDED